MLWKTTLAKQFSKGVANLDDWLWRKVWGR